MIVEEAGLKWVRREGTDDNLTSDRHEPELWALMAPHLNRELAFLDIGAHAGKYSIRAAPLSAVVYAVEPNPEMREVLLENAVLNNIYNLEIHRRAAWHKAETLFLADTDQGNGRGRVGEDGIPIEGAPLDSILEGRTRIGLVKIDVEGAEARVLQGMQTILKDDYPVVFIEMHDRSHNRPEILTDVATQLGKAGYHWLEVYEYTTAHYWRAQR